MHKIQLCLQRPASFSELETENLNHISPSRTWISQQLKKAELSQRWPRDAPYMGALEIFGSSWLRPRLLFPKFLMGFWTFCSVRSY